MSMSLQSVRHDGVKGWVAPLAGVLCVALSFGPGVPAARAETPTPSPSTPAAKPVAGDSDGDGLPDRPDTMSAALTARSTGVAVEDLSQRTQSVRVFAEPGGGFREESFAAPMWVQDAEGVWRNVDYTLVERDGGGFVPKVAPVSVVIDGGGAKEFARMLLPEGGSTVWSWPVALPTPTVDGSTATYAVADGVDLLVTATSMGVSTRIRINSADAVEPEFKVAIRTNGIDLEQGDAGQLEFSEDGERVGGSAALLAWDGRVDRWGDPVEVVPVEVELEETASKGERTDQTLTLITPEVLVADPEVEFPIIIDPDISPLRPSQDAWVRSGDTKVADPYRLLVGRIADHSNTKQTLSYMQWSNTQFAGKKIVKAAVNLYQYAAGSCADKKMNIHPVSQSWNESTMVYTTKPESMTTTGTSTSMVKNVGGDGCATANGFVTADLTKMVQAWADGPTKGGYTNYGMQLNVPSESSSDVTFERRFCSSEPDTTHTTCTTAARTPYLTMTYTRAPAAPAVASLVPASGYATYNGVPYLATATPDLKLTLGTDPDGDTVRGEIEVWPDAGMVAPKVSGCTTTYVASGGAAHCVLTYPLNRDRLWVRARTFDKYLGSAWTTVKEMRLANITPTKPVVTCAAPYSNGAWSTTVPSAPVACTVTATGSGNSAPSKIRVKVDAGATSDTTITQSSDPAVAKRTVTVPNKAGAHTVTAWAISPSGLISTVATYQFGFGTAELVTPAEAEVVTTTGRAALVASGPPKGAATVSVTTQWRVAGAESSTAGWVDASAAVAPMTVSGEGQDPLKASGTIDVGALVGQTDSAGITVPDRTSTRIEVRVCLAYPTGTQCTRTAQIMRVPHAFGRGFPTTEAGPAQVALWTGEASLSETDAELSGPGGEVSVSRSHTSFAGEPAPQNAVFGPGWVAAFEDAEGGWADAELVDNTHIDGSLIVFSSDGSELVYTTPNGNRRTTTALTAGEYQPFDEETAAEETRLKVTREANQTARVELISIDGTVTVFKQNGTVPATVQEATFRATEVSNTAVPGKTTYGYDTAGRVTTITAPLPEGVSTCVAGTPTAGCRVLKVIYAATTTATATVPGDFAGRVQRIVAQVDTDSDRTLADYAYDSAGQLVKATDTRTGLATTYTWTGTGTSLRLATLTPPGLAGYTFNYADNKITSVTRPNPETAGGGTAQLAAIVYDVDPQAASLPNLAEAVATWSQASTPTHVYAVFGQDAPIAGVPAAGAEIWRRAALQLADDQGFTVNTATWASGDWQFTGVDYDTNENVVRSWDGRATALLRAGEGTDPYLNASLTVYNDDILGPDGTTVVTPAGTLVTDSYTPVHQVLTSDGPMMLRTRATTTYDQGAPNDGINPDTSQPYRLPTKMVTRAVDETGATIETLSTSLSGYDAVETGDKSGWELGMATTTTTDMDGDGQASAADITRTTRYDTLGRTIEQRQPTSNGNDAGTRQTVYYTAGTSPVAGCGNNPAWSGRACQFGPKTQPNGQPFPTARTTSYTWDGQTAVTSEVSGGATLTSTTSFDAKDRPATTTVAVDGLASSFDVASNTTAYDDTTGLKTEVSNAVGVQQWTYDSWGRTLTYTNQTGQSTDVTTTTYDQAGRVTRVADPNGATDYTYDGTDANGDPEYRGNLTKVAVSRPGGTTYTSTGAFDLAGTLTTEHLPGKIIRRTAVDQIGKLTGLTYSGPVYDSDTEQLVDDQPWFGWSTAQNAQGQVVREWTPNGGAAYQDTEGSTTRAIPGELRYTYDKAGRLTKVTDRTGQLDDNSELITETCQIRTYEFDKNGNRTAQASTNGVTPTGACDTASPEAVTRTYDTADRPTTGANGQGTYTYDPLGRQLTIPTADTPNPTAGPIELRYFHTDEVRSIAQGDTTTTFTLDSAGRRHTQTTTTAGHDDPTSVLTRHYTDEQDNPTWSVQHTACRAPLTCGDELIDYTTRYAELINGDLGLTITTADDQTTASLALPGLRGDIATTVTIDEGTVNGIDNWTEYTEYGTAKQPVNTTPGGTTGIGYGWLGAKQRATTDLGLILMGARVYNPTSGLFTSLDPVFAGNSTAYGYPADPINTTDISGELSWRQIADIAAGVSNIAGFLPGWGTAISVAAGIVSAYAHYRNGDTNAMNAQIASTAFNAAFGLIGKLAGGAIRAGISGSGVVKNYTAKRFQESVKTSAFKKLKKKLKALPKSTIKKVRHPLKTIKKNYVNGGTAWALGEAHSQIWGQVGNAASHYCQRKKVCASIE